MKSRRRVIRISMKRSRNRLFFLSLLLLSVSCVLASPKLYNLDIRVVLSKTGDAHITETRRMMIDSEGTECYIVIGNLNGSELRDFKVVDEQGTEYENVGRWDINQSRRWKTDKCGIVTKRDGYELCWGLGDSGERIFVTSYTVTNLLRDYPDADGFNYMFVAEGMSPYPQHVMLTIVPEDSISLSEGNSGIWAFRYRGDVRFVNGSIVAESSESFGRGSAMVIMARFNKGLFEPAAVGEGTFEQLKARAFEGSDYNDDDLSKSDKIFLVLLSLFFFLVPLLLLAGYLFYLWREHRKVSKDLLWYRDIPYDGNLQQANDVLNAYKYFGADYNNLLSACILKLINDGAISIEHRTNDKGKTTQNFVIHELSDDAERPRLLSMVHKIFRDAAGSDTVLEPKELKSWMRSRYNQSYTDSFIQTLHTKTSIYQYRNEIDEVRKVFGLKKFLKEFSLLDERGVGELSLWKDYMIYATLFGIADQVIRDMKKINPEYFNMDQIARQMADETTLPMIYSTMHNSTSRAAMSKAEREARVRGGGGSSSWGGGGGFSGGGFGGGVR